MATGPIPFYLDILTKWPTAVAMASQWFIMFDIRNVPALKSNVASYVNKFESQDYGGWSLSDSTVKFLNKPEFQDQTDNLSGCVFARSITLPGESLNISHAGLDYGGFQVPATFSARTPIQDLNINFLETNASFCDFVIRPWIILTSHYGLVARSRNSAKNVKCPFMDVVQFTRAGSKRPPVIRKVTRFFDVVPKSLAPASFSQDSEGLTMRQATFSYNAYSVLEYSSGAYLNY